ncbi:MAG: biotin transporter BioY [Oscillospiraceae bacterium]|nr:biotin transporter BioY [Oscillospiraceae bacterium]
MRTLRDKGTKKLTVRDMAEVGLFTAVLVICSWISIPSTVPFTLQTLAIFLSAGLLGTRKSVAAVIVYILLGAAGVPVFSGFRAGIGTILGPTGGYMIGFIPAVIIAGAGISRFGRSFPVMAASMSAGLIVCYAFGTLWFAFVYTGAANVTGIGSILSMCVVPYIVPDAVKIILAAILSRRIYPLIRR